MNEICTCSHDKDFHPLLGELTHCQDLICPCKEFIDKSTVQPPSHLTNDDLIEITGFSIADEGWTAMHEMFQAPIRAGFTAQQALFIMCWAAFGPKFDIPKDDPTS